MVEFVVVGPLITLLGLTILQFCLLFFAKAQINHAAFMAARAGSVANARPEPIAAEYSRALIPLYGGGMNRRALQTSHAKALQDLDARHLRIELLNPIKESFDDFATREDLNTRNGARTIPHTNLAFSPELDRIKPQSGQSLQDANLLKLRITQGYEPKLPLMRFVFGKYLQWQDPGDDAFQSQLIQGGRIPVVTHVTLEMQSDAIESDWVQSHPGPGHWGQSDGAGAPDDDAGAPPESAPPDCLTVGCTVSNGPPGHGDASASDDSSDGPADSGGPGANAGDPDPDPCATGRCPVCTPEAG